MTAHTEAHVEPSWQLRKTIFEAIPATFSDEARDLMALDIGAAIAAHLGAALDHMTHTGHPCQQHTCTRDCRHEHRYMCSCGVEAARALIAVTS